MAVYTAPADTRWQNFGRGLGQGLMTLMKYKLQEGLMDKRNENAKDLDNYKREQVQKQARSMFQPQEAHVPNAEGQDPLMIPAEFTPQNTGVPQGVLNRMMMGMMGGFNPQSMMPPVHKPAPMQFHNGVKFDPNTGATSGEPFARQFAPHNEARPELIKLIEDLNKYEVGSPQHTMIKQRIEKLSTHKMSPFEQAFMLQFGLTPNGGNATKTVDDFFTNE